MNTELKLIEAVAKARGYAIFSHGVSKPGDNGKVTPRGTRLVWDLLPPWTTSLDAIQHDVCEECLTSEQMQRFVDELKWVECAHGRWPDADVPDFILLRAKAPAWCEAYVRMKGAVAA